MKWNIWSLYWLFWMVVGFGVPEGIALGTGHPGNTLSDQVWHLEGTGATFWRWVICSMLTWLVLHMTFHLFR
jgi:hypothetical protein